MGDQSEHDDANPDGNHRPTLGVRRLIERGDMLFRHHENVHGCLWIDVAKRDTRVGFVHERHRNLLAYDFAEQTVIVSHRSSARWRPRIIDRSAGLQACHEKRT